MIVSKMGLSTAWTVLNPIFLVGDSSQHTPSPRKSVERALNVEAEVNHIAVFNDVLLTFQAPFACFFRAVFTLILDEIVVANYFGPDKATLEVSVNRCGRTRCR